MTEIEMLRLRIGLLEDNLVVGNVGDGCTLLARRHLENLRAELKEAEKDSIELMAYFDER